MRIYPIRNNTKQNKVTNFTNKTPIDLPQKLGYMPQKRFSPLRQAIENLYGQKLANLNNLAERTNMPKQEFTILKNKILSAKNQEINLLKDSTLDF